MRRRCGPRQDLCRRRRAASRAGQLKRWVRLPELKSPLTITTLPIDEKRSRRSLLPSEVVHEIASDQSTSVIHNRLYAMKRGAG